MSTIFPSFHETSYPGRSLAFYEDGQLISSTGKILDRVSDFVDFAEAIIRRNLQVIIRQFLHFPWLKELIERGEVLCTKLGKPTLASLKNARIIQGSSWGFPHPGPGMLAHLEDLYAACQVGTRPSPGSLGHALLRAFWPEQAVPHGPCNLPARNALLTHGCGGRAQLFRVSKDVECYELDEVNGYADKARQYGFPTGSTYTIPQKGGYPSGYAAWYCQCEVRVSRNLALAPFGLRERDGTLYYPTAPGRYVVWLWDFQYDSALRAGLDVTIDHGYGWLELTHDFDLWVDVCANLRRAFKEMKRVIVHTFGRFNMEPVRRILKLWPEDELDQPVTDPSGRFYQLFIHSKPDARTFLAPHWYRYNATRQADATYRRALALWPHVLAMNFDALYVDKDMPGVENFKPKAECTTGEVGRTLYKTANLLKNRWFDGITEAGIHKKSTPGRSHEDDCDCETCLLEAA